MVAKTAIFQKIGGALLPSFRIVSDALRTVHPVNQLHLVLAVKKGIAYRSLNV